MILEVSGGIVSDQETFGILLRRFYAVWIKSSPSEYIERVCARGDLRLLAGNPQAMSYSRQIPKDHEEGYR